MSAVFHGPPLANPTRACAGSPRSVRRAQSSLRAETLTVVDATDSLYAQGQARAVLAEVLAAGGRSDAAVTTAEDAASIFERKGLRLLAERARAQIEKYRRGEPGQRAPLGRA